jgi:hypothetical protein
MPSKHHRSSPNFCLLLMFTSLISPGCPQNIIAHHLTIASCLRLHRLHHRYAFKTSPPTTSLSPIARLYIAFPIGTPLASLPPSPRPPLAWRWFLPGPDRARLKHEPQAVGPRAGPVYRLPVGAYGPGDVEKHAMPDQGVQGSPGGTRRARSDDPTWRVFRPADSCEK